MKFSRFFSMLSICLMLLATGCGHGGSGSEVRGTLTMSAPTVTTNGGFSLVTTTVTYTNPYVKSVGGLVVIINGVGYTLPDNGTGTAAVVVTFPVAQQATASFYTITASTADLVASVIASIPALGASTALTFTGGPATFAATAAIGDTITLVMSDATGVPPYNVTLVPATGNVTVAVNNSAVPFPTVTLTKETLATGGSTSLIISDSTSPTPRFVVVPVTY